MRLLLVTNDFPPRAGGIQQYLGNLAAAYPHPIRVLAPSAPDGGGTFTTDDLDVVRHRQRFLWPTPQVQGWVEDQAAEFEPDVLLFGAPHPLPWLGRRIGLPFAVVCHGAEVVIPAAFPVTRQLLARPLRSADAVFAVSAFTAQRVRRLVGDDPVYLGAGVDMEQFRPAGSAPGRESFVVGCVSRFVPRKGQDRLIRAAAELRRRGHPVELLLVGRGRKESSLRKLAAGLGVPAAFAVDAAWHRLGDLYRDMDVFCMPCRSRWFGLEAEGTGLVFLEAAATALPVLAGDSGGAPETVERGRTGFIVSSSHDIVEAVEMLMSDPGRARAMGQEGRERVAARFTWDRVVARLIEGLAGVV